MRQAVEADACFYIQNQAAVIGKNRLDLTIDPPPDLAIEIDITSRTRFDNYELLAVPELNTIIFWLVFLSEFSADEKSIAARLISTFTIPILLSLFELVVRIF